MPILFILAALFLSTPARGAEQAVTAGPFPACTSEAKLKQAAAAMKANDEASFRALGGCVVTKPGLNMEVLSAGKTVSKVRLFSPSGKGLVVWTDSRNVARR